MAKLGTEVWLERQLEPARIDDSDVEGRLAELDAALLEPSDRLARKLPRGMARRGMSPEERRDFRKQQQRLAQHAAGSRIVRAAHGRRELLEVMTDFWLNHFSVFARKGVVAATLESYEHDTIRPHALGRFEDLLVAVAHSPAMLLYLDNVRSRVPRVRLGRARAAGINENYARELMELHTLGVRGGYSQDDVIEVARILTGWSVTRELPSQFRFRPFLHESGPRRVMGVEIKGQGEEQGRALLRFLARHPSTARFISTKLARRFVADEPPAELIERLARRFLETQGDIRDLLRVLFGSPEFSDPTQLKLKTPLKWLASALRATAGETDAGDGVRFSLAVMGELPLFARTPEGHPDEASAWVDPSALLMRMRFAFALGSGALAGTHLGDELPQLSAEARRGIAGAPRWERAAVAVASPEFQWQ
jgi:uncharacterized protein (DUF1800 family)